MNYFYLVVLCLALFNDKFIRGSSHPSISPLLLYNFEKGENKPLGPDDSKKISIHKRSRLNNYLSNLIIDSVTENSAVITFDANKIGNNFEYNVSVSPITDTQNGLIKYSKSINKPAIKVEGLIPGAKYIVHLNISKERQTNVIQLEKEFATRPTKEKSFELIERGNTHITLRWAEDSDSYDGYVIKWSRKQCNKNYCSDVNKNETSVGKYANNFTLTGLYPGALYKIELYRTCTIEETRVFSRRLLVLITTIPYPPTNISIDSVGSNSFGLSWNEPDKSCEFTGYGFKYQENESVILNSEFINKTLTSHVHFMALKSIKPGRTYVVFLNTVSKLSYYSAFNASSENVKIRVTTQPLPVENLVANVLSNSEIYVNWTSPIESTQDSYLVKYYTENDSGNVFNRTMSNSSILITNLLPGHSYVIEVCAVSKGVLSEKRSINKPILMNFHESTTFGSSEFHPEILNDMSDNVFENESPQEISKETNNGLQMLRISSSVLTLRTVIKELNDKFNALDKHVHDKECEDIDKCEAQKPPIIDSFEHDN